MGKRRALASVIEQAAQYPELVTDPELLQYSVGIMAYNEAANIGKCRASVLAQRLTSADIEEILVIASGCTDNTAEVVEESDPGECSANLHRLCSPLAVGPASLHRVVDAQTGRANRGPPHL